MQAPAPLLSVILCTHRPHRGRLERTLRGLAAQDLPSSSWECLLVDNNSGDDFPSSTELACGPTGLRVLREPRLGLSHARRRGVLEARAPVLVFVDDDNVLAPDYLSLVLGLFADNPGLGALGGRSLPEFETAPPDWLGEFHSLLALRDLGPREQCSPAGGKPLAEYPPCAPIGAGMALRREALGAWLQAGDTAGLPDRQGDRLSSSGDNDMVAHVLEQGWQAGYFPQLSLRHLIPAGRLSPDYLSRLNRGIQESWIAMLDAHGLRPWPPCSLPGAWLRILRAWLRHKPWRSPANRVRFHGALGAFLARARLHPPSRRAGARHP